MNNSQNSRAFTILIIGIVLGVAFCILGYLLLVTTMPVSVSDKKSGDATTPTKEVVKIDTTKDIVYNVEDSSIYANNYVPKININLDSISNINNEIMNYYNDFKSKVGSGTPSDHMFSYRYYENKEILSLVVLRNYSEASSAIETKIININKYTGALVSDSDILKLADSNIFEKAVEVYKTVDSWDAYLEYMSSYPFEETRQKEIDNYKNNIYDKNINSISNKEYTGLYVNGEKVYIVMTLNAAAGSGRMPLIIDVNNSKIYHLSDGTHEYHPLGEQVKN